MEKKFSYALFVIILLILIVSLFSIFSDEAYLDMEERLSFRATDFANVFLGIPYFLVGLFMLLRRNERWLWIVPGALFYGIYVFIPYVFALEFSILFLPYLLIICLCIYTLVMILATRNYNRILGCFQNYVPVKQTVSVLMLLGLIVFLRQSVLAVRAGIQGLDVGMIDIAVWFDDLVLGSPVLFLASYFLYRKRSIGYLIGPGMLLCYAVLSLGLMPYFFLEKRYTGNPIQWDGIIIIAAMVLICAIPFIRAVNLFLMRMIRGNERICFLHIPKTFKSQVLRFDRLNDMLVL